MVIELVTNLLGDFKDYLSLADALLETDVAAWFDYCDEVPPSIAPGMEPIPPITAAVNALIPGIEPRVGSSEGICIFFLINGACIFRMIL